jgi:Protein of unknown function (DUF3047)
MPRVAAAAALALLALSAAGALAADAPTILVEDWSRQPEGKTGIPSGWKGHAWGSPKYDFAVVVDGPARALRLRSQGDNSTITKDVAIDVKKFPILTWRWKVVTLPAGADSRRKETDDQAVQLYVTFPRFPTAMRSRVIGYVWDTTVPAGTFVPSQNSNNVTYVIQRSGDADRNRWLTETRNVFDDYRRIFGEEPAEELRAVSVAIDSNDTRSSAEAFVGDVRFRRP